MRAAGASRGRDLKGLIARGLVSPLAMRVSRAVLLRGRSTIFTLHRFAHPRGDPGGIRAEELDDTLVRLRRLGFRFVPLIEIAEHVRAGREPPANSIAFTVDDGYFDFAEVAAPVFARHECPVTVFLISGFLDGTIVPWWDQVARLFQGTSCNEFDLRLGGHPLSLRWQNPEQKSFAALTLLERLKRLPTDEKHAAIRAIAEGLGVALVDRPNDSGRPMSWGEVRRLADSGVHFGPHTVTHPILSRASPQEAESEITGSWQRLKAEVPSAVPLFAYPNGQPGDFGIREAAALEAAGIMAAVTTSQGHVDGRADPFRLPRFDLVPEPSRFGQVVSGVEVTKAKLRRAPSPAA